MKYSGILLTAAGALAIAAAPGAFAQSSGMGPGMMGPMMIAVMDANEDGAVSLKEMETVHKRLFNLVDADEDGKVTIEEMRPGMGGAGRGMMGQGMMGQGGKGQGMMGGGMMTGRGMMGPMMIAVLDTDEDGAVSFDEAEAVRKRMFKLLDANKDGKATLDELHAFMNAAQQ